MLSCQFTLVPPGGFMNTVAANDMNCRDPDFADLRRRAQSLQRDAGAVAAWIYLSRLDVPDATILALLADADDPLQISAGPSYATILPE